MKKVSDQIDDLLIQFLDGNLTGEKLEKIKQGLSTSEELRDRLEVLKLIQTSMESPALMHPSSNFTKKVMNNLHRATSQTAVTPKNGLLLLLGILIAIGIGATLVDSGFFNSVNGMLSIKPVDLPSGIKSPGLPSIPFNGKVIVNSLIALNLGLAFLLLDRFVFKPLFHRKSRMQF